MYCQTTLSPRHLPTLAAILFGLIATPAIARDSNSLMDISSDGRLLDLVCGVAGGYSVGRFGDII